MGWDLKLNRRRRKRLDQAFDRLKDELQQFAKTGNSVEVAIAINEEIVLTGDDATLFLFIARQLEALDIKRPHVMEEIIRLGIQQAAFTLLAEANRKPPPKRPNLTSHIPVYIPIPVEIPVVPIIRDRYLPSDIMDLPQIGDSSTNPGGTFH